MTLVKWMKQDAVLVRDCMTLFIFAIFIFYLESLAWPIHPGRDMGTYLAYYVDFFNKDPFYYFLMVFSNADCAVLDRLVECHRRFAFP